VIGRLSDMILTECAQSSVPRQEAIASRMEETIDGLSPEEFPALTENAEALLNHVRTSACGSAKREVALEYAAATIEMLGAQIERSQQRHEPRDEPKSAESAANSEDIGDK
jgi:hypothetical protein